MTLTARDVMTQNVVCLDPELLLLEAHEILADRKISGAPVTDRDGRLLGVISRSDLMTAVEEQHAIWAEDRSFFGEYHPLSVPAWLNLPRDFNAELADVTVQSAMTQDLVTVSLDAPVREVAQLMHSKQIHRVLVVENSRLVGIVSSMDLVRLLTSDPSELARQLQAEKPGALERLASIAEHRKKKTAPKP